MGTDRRVHFHQTAQRHPMLLRVETNLDALPLASSLRSLQCEAGFPTPGYLSFCPLWKEVINMQSPPKEQGVKLPWLRAERLHEILEFFLIYWFIRPFTLPGSHGHFVLCFKWWLSTSKKASQTHIVPALLIRSFFSQPLCTPRQCRECFVSSCEGYVVTFWHYMILQTYLVCF